MKKHITDQIGAGNFGVVVRSEAAYLNEIKKMDASTKKMDEAINKGELARIAAHNKFEIDRALLDRVIKEISTTQLLKSMMVGKAAEGFKNLNQGGDLLPTIVESAMEKEKEGSSKEEKIEDSKMTEEKSK